jgi:hypothetical protein
MNILEKYYSINEYQNLVASRNNMEQVFVLKLIAGVVYTGDKP